MGKKKTSSAAKAGRGRGTSVTELRRRLDRLDRDLVKAVNERARLAADLSAARREAGDRTDDFAFDERLLRDAVEQNRGPLADESIRSIFREILSAARSLIRPVRVAYLGPMYSYSYLAAVERFGESAELAPVGTIAAVFEEINRGHADHGVVPLENSTDGRVADTLDMFARLPVRIGGEVQLRIRHNLLAKCARNEIQEVYSKPQALSQCREWLAKHLPWSRTVEMTSTTAAAQLAATKPGAAAVASLVAASNYGLDVIAADIQDNRQNVTRFAVIGSQSAPRTGKDKTAIMFEIPHRAGALADAMNIFKRARINLTWIESFPISGSQNEYLFFVEADGHEQDAKLVRTIASLQRKTVRMVVLGSYAKSEPLE